MRTFRLKRFVWGRQAVQGGHVQRQEAASFSVSRSRTVRGGERLTKTRISWDASPDPFVVGYRVYWAVNGSVDYDSEYADVGNVTALVLPDDIPSFPLVTSCLEIGITAVSRGGNESDMSVKSAFFHFSRPEAPLNVHVGAI